MARKSILSSFEAFYRNLSFKEKYQKSAKELFKVSYDFSRSRNSEVDDVITISLLTLPNGVFLSSYRFEIGLDGISPAFYFSNFDNNSLLSLALYLFIDLLRENYTARNDIEDKWEIIKKALFKKEKQQFFYFIDSKYQDSVEKEIQREEEPVHLEIVFEPYPNSTYLVAEYRVGRYKTYSVSSPSAFFERFKRGDKHKYGKDLTLIHVLEAFDETSQKIIKYFMTRASLNSRGKFHYLTANEVRDIMELSKDSYVYWTGSNDDTAVRYLVRLDEVLPKIRISSDYMLSFVDFDESKILFDRYIINEEKHEINVISNDETYNNLVFAILKYDYPCIEDNIDDFKYSYYLRYQDNFLVDRSIEDNFIFIDLRIDAYFDFENNKLKVDTRLFSGDEEISEDGLNKYNRSQYHKYQSLLTKYGFINGVCDNEAFIWKFLNSSLESLKQVCNVYLSDSILSKNVSSFTAPNIRVSYNNNLLDVFLEDSRYTDEELIAILNAIKKKKKYVLLKNKVIGVDTEAGKNFLENAKKYELLEKENEHYKRVPLYYAFKSLDDSNGVSLNEKIFSVFDSIKNYKSSALKIAKINGELRPYQVEGVKWLDILYHNNLSGILADDMGLGKTIEIIAFLKTEKIEDNVLIVAPKTLLFNWKNEFLRFDEKAKVQIIYGTVNERTKIINSISSKKGHIYVTSYDSLRRDINLYKEINFDTVILDEAQYIKNSKAQKTESVNKLKATHKFALTGTPIENSILDLWSIFNFLMPNYLIDIQEFKTNYETLDDYANVVKKYVAPFILRRNKKDVLKDLPDKYLTIVSCEMTPGQQKVYDSQVLLAKKVIEESGGAFDVLRYLIRLRQACIDPRLFVDNYSGGSGKLTLLKELIESRLNDGHKILIFSQFVMALNLVEKILQDLDISYFMITGDTKGEDRVKIANEFNATRRYSVGLVSLKAGGTGLNLVGADVVIHLDPWWNLATENQATDRAHRIGQERNVEVIKLISEHSVEERVVELQNIKKDLIDKVISDDDTSITSLSIEDIKFILK